MFDNNQELKFLDNILKELNDDISKSLSFESLVDKLSLDKEYWELGKYKPLFIDSKPKTYENYPKLFLALDYLCSEKYIFQMGREFKISYFGMVKLKTNSFSKDYISKNWGTPREKILLFILSLSLFINVISSIFRVFTSCNT